MPLTNDLSKVWSGNGLQFICPSLDVYILRLTRKRHAHTTYIPACHIPLADYKCSLTSDLLLSVSGFLQLSIK